MVRRAPVAHPLQDFSVAAARAWSVAGPATPANQRSGHNVHPPPSLITRSLVGGLEHVFAVSMCVYIYYVFIYIYTW